MKKNEKNEKNSQKMEQEASPKIEIRRAS